LEDAIKSSDKSKLRQFETQGIFNLQDDVSPFF
jgi:hypothetical protein